MDKIYQKPFSDGKNAGFTLIELLVVVLIIGILAAVALPQYQAAVIKARFTKFIPLAVALRQAQERYYMANGAYASSLTDLDIDLPSSCSIHRGNDNMYVCENGWMLDNQLEFGRSVGNLFITYCPQWDGEDWRVCYNQALARVWFYFQYPPALYPGETRCVGNGSALANQLCATLIPS